MSLDVYLTVLGHVSEPSTKIFIREGGQNKEISRSQWDEMHPDREPVTVCTDAGETVFEWNITHNLIRMAAEAGIYKDLWRPDELGIVKAEQLIEPLKRGLCLLVCGRERFEKFNPANGWGDYEGLVRFVWNYLGACQKWPQADVRVSR